MSKYLTIKNNKVVSEVNSHLKSLVEDATRIVGEYFDYSTDFSIVFLESRKELDDVHLSKTGITGTEDWVVGGTYGDDTLYLFDIDVYSKESCHPDNSFFPTLVHEMTHIFVQKLFTFNYPMWLNEGLAYVLANQDLETLRTKQDLTKAFTLEEWSRSNPYLTSGKFTRHLIKLFGKEKLFSLIRFLEYEETKESFYKKFKECLGLEFFSVWNSWTQS